MKQDYEGLDLCIDEKVSGWMRNFDVKIFCGVIRQHTLGNILIWKWKKVVYLGWYIKQILYLTGDVMLE